MSKLKGLGDAKQAASWKSRLEARWKNSERVHFEDVEFAEALIERVEELERGLKSKQTAIERMRRQLRTAGVDAASQEGVNERLSDDVEDWCQYSKGLEAQLKPLREHVEELEHELERCRLAALGNDDILKSEISSLAFSAVCDCRELYRKGIKKLESVRELAEMVLAIRPTCIEYHFKGRCQKEEAAKIRAAQAKAREVLEMLEVKHGT